jgi:hypothetical protein
MNWNYDLHKAYAAEQEARARRAAQIRAAQHPEEAKERRETNRR